MNILIMCVRLLQSNIVSTPLIGLVTIISSPIFMTVRLLVDCVQEIAQRSILDSQATRVWPLQKDFSSFHRRTQLRPGESSNPNLLNCSLQA